MIATGYHGNTLHIHTIRMYLPILQNLIHTYVYNIMYVHVSDKAAICTLLVHGMVDTDLLYVLNIHTYMHTYIQYIYSII